MENHTTSDITCLVEKNLNEQDFTGNNTSTRSNKSDQNFINIITTGGEILHRYLKSQGIPEKSDLIILTPNHHYYYDESDMRNISTLINLKKLNQIKHLEKFLHSLFRILPADANFIGCFSDSRNRKRRIKLYLSDPSRLLNKFRNFLDSKTDRDMDRNEVLKLFAANGFRIIDMTEIDGITYFHSKIESESVVIRRA
ncbi:MAG: hypothetical protein JW982_12135 [Spirochaetes bacterium]|nr:hypothetical protein [Spirochaetota bacterium]